MSTPKIIFIGAGSTTFAKNISGDAFHRGAPKTAHTVLMDVNPTHLEESHTMVRRLMDPARASGKITCHAQQKEALQDADFVVVAFQVGGYEPCTVTDFEVCKRHGLEQTIADALGPGGIMRALRTVPYLWQICEDMTKVCPNAVVLNYVNLMAMNTWAMYARYPHTKQVGLCHSVQGTVKELARDLNIDPATLHYSRVGINHMALYLELERKTTDGSYANLYPELLAAYEAGQAPKPSIHGNTRYQSIVRYETSRKLGYFVTGSSGHFAECTPWSIKLGHEDLIECYKVPLDEYPKRCAEQLANWHKELEEYENTSRINIKSSREYANTIMNVVRTGEPSVIYDNVHNDGLIDNLPQGCCAGMAYLVDANGIQPTKVGTLPSHLVALMQTDINVQTPLTEAILTENRDRVYHATMMNLRTATVLGIDEIYTFVDDLIAAHGD